MSDAPHGAVPRRVEGGPGLPGGAAGHVHPHRLPDGEVGGDALVVAERRVVLDAAADVVDGVGRSPPQVVEGLQLARVEPGGVPSRSVERDGVRPPRLVDQTGQLGALDDVGARVVGRTRSTRAAAGTSARRRRGRRPRGGDADRRPSGRRDAVRGVLHEGRLVGEVAVGEPVEVDRVVPQDLAPWTPRRSGPGAAPGTPWWRAGTSSRGGGSRSRTRCGRRPSSGSRR